MLVSLLDDVPGLGDTRRKALMKKFGSLKRLRAASLEELMTVPGIGRRTAEAVQAAIAEPADPEESTLAPDGPAERGEPTPDAGDTAEVGRVGAGR
jgi:excinuclease ABC subunit C